MRRILVCTGVLGGGTALVFALAALTAVAFPQGTLVSTGWNGGGWERQGWGGGVVPMPAPMPAVDWAPAVEKEFVIDGFAAPNDGFQPLPGDIVTTVDGETLEVAPVP
jgi:hypothetical protein